MRRTSKIRSDALPIVPALRSLPQMPISEIEIGARKSHNEFAEFLKMLSAYPPAADCSSTTHERKVLSRNSFMRLQTRHGEKPRFFRGFREPVASLQNVRARLQTRKMPQAFALFSFRVTMPTSLQAAAQGRGPAAVPNSPKMGAWFEWYGRCEQAGCRQIDSWIDFHPRPAQRRFSPVLVKINPD